MQVAAGLRRSEGVPAAVAASELVEGAALGWEGRVVARTSHYDLLFTRPGDDYPFEEQVRVAWDGGIFTFTLQAEHGKLVTADRARRSAAADVLDAFLAQLVGDG